MHVMENQVLAERLATAIKKLNPGLQAHLVEIAESLASDYSIEDYNREIEEAEKEIERGDFYTMEEVQQLTQNTIRSFEKR